MNTFSYAGGGGGGRALCKHLWKVGRGDGVIWGHMGTGTSWCQHNSMARLAKLPTSHTQITPCPELAAVKSVFISCILILSLHINVNNTENCYCLYTPTWICDSAKHVLHSLLILSFLIRITGEVRSSIIRNYLQFFITSMGTAVAQWLRCCATNRKVAGSIPVGFIGIFHWYKILPIALWPWGRLSL